MLPLRRCTPPGTLMLRATPAGLLACGSPSLPRLPNRGLAPVSGWRIGRNSPLTVAGAATDLVRDFTARAAPCSLFTSALERNAKEPMSTGPQSYGPPGAASIIKAGTSAAPHSPIRDHGGGLD